MISNSTTLFSLFQRKPNNGTTTTHVTTQTTPSLTDNQSSHQNNNNNNNNNNNSSSRSNIKKRQNNNNSCQYDLAKDEQKSEHVPDIKVKNDNDDETNNINGDNDSNASNDNSDNDDYLSQNPEGFVSATSSPFKQLNPKNFQLSTSLSSTAPFSSQPFFSSSSSASSSSSSDSSLTSPSKKLPTTSSTTSSTSSASSSSSSSSSKLGIMALLFQTLIFLSVCIVTASLISVPTKYTPPSLALLSSTSTSSTSTSSTSTSSTSTFTTFSFSSLSNTLVFFSSRLPPSFQKLFFSLWAYSTSFLNSVYSSLSSPTTTVETSTETENTATLTPNSQLNSDSDNPSPAFYFSSGVEAVEFINSVDSLLPANLVMPEDSQLLKSSTEQQEQQQQQQQQQPLITNPLPALDRLKAFLKHIKTEVSRAFHPLQLETLSSRRKLHAVIGNEASDLDSMATSIILAFYLEHTRFYDSNTTLIVPVMNIPRRDFRLRTEVSYMFLKNGLTPDMLLFMDDLDLQLISKRGLLELTLVDHNLLAPQQQVFASSVVSILDHHSDEKHYMNSVDRHVELVGSCSTLLTERIFNTSRGLTPFPFNFSSPFSTGNSHNDFLTSMIDNSIAELLLGTILVDTVNLDTVKGKTTPKDIQAAAQLMELLHGNFSRTELFSNLRREKFNHAALTSDELLRRDYKEDRSTSVSIGISSISMSTRQLVDKDRSYARSIAKFAMTRNVRVLLVMNSYFAPDFSRELTVYVQDKKLLKRVLSHLFRNGIVDFGLTKLHVPGVTGESKIVTFSQSNLKASRKFYMPLMKGLFSGNMETLRQQLLHVEKGSTTTPNMTAFKTSGGSSKSSSKK